MKYAFVFSLLSASLLFNAWGAGSWWSAGLLTWAGIAFALVATAYAGNAVWIFGKRNDGRTRILPTLILLPYRLLAVVTWWLNTRLSSEEPCHRVDDRLVVGRRLAAWEGLPQGISSVLDLTSEFTEPDHLRKVAGYRCLPMLDASHADPQAIAAVVQEFAGHSGVLYVHCAQGHGRTGLMAALILVVRNPGLSADAALARLRAIRPGIGLSHQQHRALLDIAKRLAEA